MEMKEEPVLVLASVMCACLYVCVHTPCGIEMTSWNVRYVIPSLSEIPGVTWLMAGKERL